MLIPFLGLTFIRVQGYIILGLARSNLNIYNIYIYLYKHVDIYCIYIKFTHVHMIKLYASKLENNWQFLMEFYATFAPLGVPSLSRWKASLVDSETFNYRM